MASPPPAKKHHIASRRIGEPVIQLLLAFHRTDRLDPRPQFIVTHNLS